MVTTTCNSLTVPAQSSPWRQCFRWHLKGIDRSFEVRGESRLIWSVMTNWRLGNLFFHLKGTPSQDQQKTFRRRLITFKVTLTGQSHFMLIFWLRKVTLRGHINSIKWPPHTQASVSPPWTKGGGTHSPAVEGTGGSQFGRLEKKPSTLSTLCYV